MPGLPLSTRVLALPCISRFLAGSRPRTLPWACVLLLLAIGLAHPARASDVTGAVTFTPKDANLQKGGEVQSFRAEFKVVTNAADAGGVRFDVTESDDFTDDKLLQVTVSCQPSLPAGTTVTVRVGFRLQCTGDCKLQGAGLSLLEILDAAGQTPVCGNPTLQVTKGTSDEESKHEVVIEDVGDGDNSNAELILRCQPRAMQTTGWLNPPGPGSRLDYKVTARKVPGTSADLAFWLELFNTTDQPITVFACAMLRLDKPDITMDQYVISKEGGVWDCEAAGTVSRPPGYHFGCRRVTVPPKGADGKPGEATAYDVVRTLSQSFETADVSSVYWDVLEDCPVTPACQNIIDTKLDKPDVNVSPAVSDIITNAANVWGGSIVPEGLDSVNAYFELGNWVTMMAPDEYPARFVGSITNAPPGSRFTLTLPDTSFTWIAPAHGVIDIDEPFVIPFDMEAIGILSFEPAAPMAEGSEWRFDVDVVAEPGNPLWAAGEHMHDVQLTAAQDRVPPEIETATVVLVGNRLLVDVLASDVTTMAAAASIRVQTPQGFDMVFPVDFAAPAMVEERTHFRSEVGPLPPAEFVTWELQVADENGNVAGLNGTATGGVLAIPTLSATSLAALALLLAGFGVWRLRRRSQAGGARRAVGAK